jgi:hypothetical protein
MDEEEQLLRNEFDKDWVKNKWYTTAQIASKLNAEQRTVRGWRNPGLKRKDGNGFIILKSVKLSGNCSRGSWVIDFLVERNLYGKD